MTDKYKILKRKEDCVLLYKSIGNDAKYLVKDIEGDIIYMCYNNLEKAEKEFEACNVNKMREAKKREFEKWLDMFTEE